MKTTKRLVYICDWLPPDFGAVGQYAVLFARQWAREGWVVTLVGLTSGPSHRQAAESVDDGSLEVLRVHRHTYKKQKFAARLVWTVVSNFLLLGAAFRAMRRADAVLFTGSPPLMVHFIAPLNLLLRKTLIYRITDFHPECLIAERGRSGPILGLLLRVTRFWRRRVDAFEVLGLDQARRLAENGIAESRIRVKRDPSPVVFPPGIVPLPLPPDLRGAPGIILYSGNWGVAHDENTFIDAYARYFRSIEAWSSVLVECDWRQGRSRRTRVARTRCANLPIKSGPPRGPSAATHGGGCAPDHAARCLRRLCAAFENSCLHRIGKKNPVRRQ